ncbi:helix-turn-helix domain-containing protein [Saccharibacillus sacchari]|uniref:helix-turn-helix domain-containing protein n=1 Tax=Saccharibacillus sacchari TaxID=456493 RepID=UPI000559D318|nr:helix-turn-helix domain-containing protein [Saccharibacillus sacchari]
MKRKQNFFLKDSDEKNQIFDKLRDDFGIWKRNVQEMNKPFFAIHTDFKQLFLKDISGGALKLYIYLGFHAKYYTGELWHTNEEISSFFEKDQRTITTWFKELEEIGLIFREQKGFRMKANTFLRPYGFSFHEASYFPDTKNPHNQIIQQIETSIALKLELQFVLIANFSLKEFTIITIYKIGEVYECFYFLNFYESHMKSLRTSLKNLEIKFDNIDIDSPLSSSKNLHQSLYNTILKYLEDSF